MSSAAYLQVNQCHLSVFLAFINGPIFHSDAAVSPIGYRFGRIRRLGFDTLGEGKEALALTMWAELYNYLKGKEEILIGKALRFYGGEFRG
jgi:hypothetical protein